LIQLYWDIGHLIVERRRTQGWGRSVVTVGEIPPIRRAARAAVGKKARVALVGGDGETFARLLELLDAALGGAMADDSGSVQSNAWRRFRDLLAAFLLFAYRKRYH
jgi:hypothetical protein